MFAAVAIGCAWMVCAGRSPAQVIAFDDAADPAYADGWDEGDNGGFGFQPWTGGIYGNPIAIDSAPEADNNLGAPAFQLGTGGQGYWAIRPFGSPMQVGQTFKMDIDPFAFPTDAAAAGEFQSLIRLSAGGSGNAQERIALYSYAFYEAGTILYGSDKWGVVAETTNDGLNGGAPLPTSPCYATGCTSYSMLDSSDGFSLVLDLLTIDTYRLRVVDDDVTKLDITGQLNADSAGQGIDQIVFWAADGSGATIDNSYFTNLEIVTTPSERLDGDFNNDRQVDAADYTLWRDNLGATDESSIHNNGDQQNGVDAADFAIWKSGFGDSSGPGGAAGASVPEPASWFAALLGLSTAFWQRRRAV